MSLAVDTKHLAPRAGAVQDIPHDQLRPSDLNPRKHARAATKLDELAASILLKGVLQNLVARPMIGVSTPVGSREVYEIAAGEGRWRAVAMLIEQGKAPADYPMPVSVRELSDEEVIEIGLIENLDREDLTPLDQGRAFLDLWKRAEKRGGRKAVGALLDKLADRFNKTKRFIQERMALARDLEPAAAELLESGRIDLAAAKILAKAPAKEQQRLVVEAKKADSARDEDKFFRDPLAADQLADRIDMRDIKSALFDIAKYAGETIEHRGHTFATDVKAFDALQKEALAALTLELRKQVKEGEIAFLDNGDWFPAHDYDQDKANEAGGVFIEKERDGSVTIYRGLTKKPKRDNGGGHNYAAAEKKRRQKQDREKAERILDPRAKTVREQLAKSPKIALAVALYGALNDIDWDGQLCSLAQRGSLLQPEVFNGEQRAAGLKVLKAVGSVPKGGAMLAWLLEQNLTTLAGAFAALAAHEIDDNVELFEEPEADVAALFEACGAELEDGWLEKARAAAQAKVEALDKKGKKKSATKKKKGARK